jgi:hypothetical protein
MPTSTDARYWIQTTDDADDTSPDMTDWYAVVDEEAGGIIAYTGTLEQAQIIRAALMQKA